MRAGDVLRFGRFALDRRRRLLLRDGAPVPATPKTLDLLEVLVDRAGRTVTKEEVVRNIWHDDAVSDATIVQHVLMLRKILGDEYHAHDYIVTVPKRGYKFVGRVHAAATAATSDEAFRAYCHGQYLLQQRTAEGLDEAVRWFERAALLDPAFAPAHAGAAGASAMSGIYMHSAPTRAFPRARRAVERALALSEDASSYTILAEVCCYFEQDWSAALVAHRRALELQPDSAQAHHSLAWFYVCTGDVERALAEITHALGLDPSSLTLAANRGIVLTYLERYADALEQFAVVLELSPRFSLGRYLHASALLTAGEFDSALNELLFVEGFRFHTQALEAECHAYLGHTDAARRTFADLLAGASSAYVSPYFFARIHVALGEAEQAVTMLERSRLERVAWTAFAAVDPTFGTLRGLPSFERFVEKLRQP
jgi:DNA-binding winged helix-turn-helix (wHTH) protein/lipoprotein NlpI